LGPGCVMAGTLVSLCRGLHSKLTIAARTSSRRLPDASTHREVA
jgi:hypothetical protein